MRQMEIDDEGLDSTDRKLLAAIVQKFASGPVGVQALAAVLSEEVETIEDVYEPFLLRLGFLDRTPQGRIATDGGARRHLARSSGFEIPPPRRHGAGRLGSRIDRPVLIIGGSCLGGSSRAEHPAGRCRRHHIDAARPGSSRSGRCPELVRRPAERSASAGRCPVRRPSSSGRLGPASS